MNYVKRGIFNLLFLVVFCLSGMFYSMLSESSQEMILIPFKTGKIKVSSMQFAIVQTKDGNIKKDIVIPSSFIVQNPYLMEKWRWNTSLQIKHKNIIEAANPAVVVSFFSKFYPLIENEWEGKFPSWQQCAQAIQKDKLLLQDLIDLKDSLEIDTVLALKDITQIDYQNLIKNLWFNASKLLIPKKFAEQNEYLLAEKDRWSANNISSDDPVVIQIFFSKFYPLVENEWEGKFPSWRQCAQAIREGKLTKEDFIALIGSVLIDDLLGIKNVSREDYTNLLIDLLVNVPDLFTDNDLIVFTPDEQAEIKNEINKRATEEVKKIIKDPITKNSFKVFIENELFVKQKKVAFQREFQLPMKDYHYCDLIHDGDVKIYAVAATGSDSNRYCRELVFVELKISS